MKKRLVNYRFLLCAVVLCGLLASLTFTGSETHAFDGKGSEKVSASFTLIAASANSQERKALPNKLPIIEAACPKPIIALTLTATAPNVLNSDFNSAQLGAPRAWLNDSSFNKSFLYTFQWKREERCCQITRALLTVKVKANQRGLSSTSSDAGNDSITIMHSGVSVQSEAIYYNYWPFSVGLMASKSVTLNPAALNNLNATGQLSFDVQDDTSVQSATLQLWGCCLIASTPQTTAYPSQSECEQHEKAACSFQYGGWHRTN